MDSLAVIRVGGGVGGGRGEIRRTRFIRKVARKGALSFVGEQWKEFVGGGCRDYLPMRVFVIDCGVASAPLVEGNFAIRLAFILKYLFSGNSWRRGEDRGKKFSLREARVRDDLGSRHRRDTF
jgi:hypothetical protein